MIGGLPTQFAWTDKCPDPQEVTKRFRDADYAIVAATVGGSLGNSGTWTGGARRVQWTYKGKLILEIRGHKEHETDGSTSAYHGPGHSPVCGPKEPGHSSTWATGGGALEDQGSCYPVVTSPYGCLADDLWGWRSVVIHIPYINVDVLQSLSEDECYELRDLVNLISSEFRLGIHLNVNYMFHASNIEKGEKVYKPWWITRKHPGVDDLAFSGDIIQNRPSGMRPYLEGVPPFRRGKGASAAFTAPRLPIHYLYRLLRNPDKADSWNEKRADYDTVYIDEEGYSQNPADITACFWIAPWFHYAKEDDYYGETTIEDGYKLDKLSDRLAQLVYGNHCREIYGRLIVNDKDSVTGRPGCRYPADIPEWHSEFKGDNPFDVYGADVEVIWK